jgi:formylglycine-generating enzyme required for sulfatase activity
MLAVGIMGAGAQQPNPKPTLAVLVVGMETDSKGDDLAAWLGGQLNRDNKYTLLGKTNTAVAGKLIELRTIYAQGGTVDTTELAKWERRNGVDMVQLVVTSRVAAAAGDRPAEKLVGCQASALSGRDGNRQSKSTVLQPDMTFVVGGIFEMGCKPDRDGTCSTNETPPHMVTVSSFNIGTYEVTQAQWKAVMGSLPSNIRGNYLGDDKPVTYVSYEDIAGVGGYLEKLNEATGLCYRLPTEAEWEYVARGCNAGRCESYQYSGGNNLGDVAWYVDNCPNASPQPVGTKTPNTLGVYDMSGNVFEWCRDHYTSTFYSSAAATKDNPENTSAPSFHVVRGGSWYGNSNTCRVADRDYDMPSNLSGDYGFRVVLP